MAFQPSPISVLPTPQGTDQPYNTPRPTREGTILPKITQPPTGADDGSLLTLEARETQIVRTFTPVPPALTPITRPIQTTSIAINDAYGQRIGTGQILVRAPNVMQPDSEAKIRVEIELFPLSNEPTLVPPPSSTPLEAKLQATPTAIPTITGGAATSDIFEFTSVEIDGLNKDRFNLKPDLTNGVRKIIRGVRYSWQWSISPREAAKALSTDFEALIFAQRDVEPSTQRVLVTRVPFKISVQTPVSAAPLLAILAVLVLIAIGGGVGVVALRSRTSNWGTERIFISYRRADTRDMTERIRDELAQHFGSKAIFKDIGSIEYGEDYRQRLEASVKRADVVLVMIGTQYLTITDAATGERRLFQPNDFVRLEVELGLQNNKTVIPLLVDGATMPKADDLPPSIRELSFRNALPVRPDPDFHADMERLRLAIEKVLSKPNTNR
jgi:hypothetical protein